MSYPYTPPIFLDNQSVNEIHQRMMDTLPEDIDKSELQIPWDLTRPAALLKSEFAGYEINEAIKLIFPQWSYGEWLDYHAEMARVTRREANKASGILTITGTIGVIIPAGFQFATLANITSSILFESIEEVILSGTPDESGQVTVSVEIEAVEGGIIGNVPPDAIKLMVKPLSGIAYISNAAATTGGTPVESDDSLIERILVAKRQGSSYVGNPDDYIRWANEVSGVGSAICVSTPFGPGTVELIIVDGNGLPANQQILDAVYSHIMGDGPEDIDRLAPIGAILTVVAPESILIDISASVLLNEGEEIDIIIDRFQNNLVQYWHLVALERQDDAENKGYVRLVKVGAVLSDTQGIKDYSDLLINGSTENIEILLVQYPTAGTITLNGITKVYSNG